MFNTCLLTVGCSVVVLEELGLQMASTPVRCNSKRAGRSSVKARKSNKTSEIIIIDDDNDEEDETKGLDQQCPHSTYQEGKSTGRKRKSSQEKEPAIKKKQRLNPGNRKENHGGSVCQNEKRVKTKKPTRVKRTKLAATCTLVKDTQHELSWNVEEELAERLDLPLNISFNVINLMEADNTIPFIARYRKESTGGMDVDKLRMFAETLDNLKVIQTKARTMIQSILKLDKMTPQLLTVFQHARNVEELEHLYAPFRSSKKTLAERAKLLGLEQPALNFLSNPCECHVCFGEYVQPSKKGLSSMTEVETGIKHIIADYLAKDYTVLKYVKDVFTSDKLLLESKIHRNFGKMLKEQSQSNEMNKYELYYDFKKRVVLIQPHQVLAINRGESLKVLSVKIEIPRYLTEKFFEFVYSHVCKGNRPKHEVNIGLLEAVIKDMYDRFIEPLICRKARSDLTKNAEKASTEVFALNLRNLLLTAPVCGQTIAAIDPGFKNGCKLAVISPNGAVLDTDTLYLHTRNNFTDTSKLINIILKYGATIVGIGNGTACRETEAIVSNAIKNGSFGTLDIVYCIVNESGISVYSVSEEAIQEFPDMDPNHRSAVSLGRRILDPLSEYVKVEPKHLGVGMYQHDISETILKKSLDSVVEECVSFVGVDLNVCSKAVLSKVAGLSCNKADAMVKWRQENAHFINREQIKLVPGIGSKTFEQCAGFLRIRSETLGDSCIKPKGNLKVSKNQKKAVDVVCTPNPLDSTCIHPESYAVAHKLISAAQCELSSIGTPQFIKVMQQTLNESKLTSLSFEYSVGIATLRLIAEGLQKSLDYDIRSGGGRPLFKQGIRDIDSLKIGMRLSGKVQNVTSFGVFVDIGVGVNGLIHKTKMKDSILCGTALCAGNTVEAEVLEVDRRKNRISLSLVSVLERSTVNLR